MTPDEAFLEDICAHAEDDAPRLIYADWLEEHGQPDRAEFIRVQCRLADLTPGAAEYVDLQERERDLYPVGRQHNPAMPKGFRCEWHGSLDRGFPDWINIWTPNIGENDTSLTSMFLKWLEQ